MNLTSSNKRILSLLLLALAFNSCSSKSPQEISFIISHNILGEIESCGCQDYPRGGLAQVQGYLNQAVKKRPTYFIDLGDSLFPSTFFRKKFSESLIKKSRIIENFLLNQNLYFWLPGEIDFALGKDFILKSSLSSKIFISNIKGNFQHKEILLGSKKIAIISLTDQEFYPLDSIINPISFLQEYLHKLQNDYIIIFSHLGKDQDIQIAQRFSQINFIFGSHSESFLQKPLLVNKTLIGQALSKNHHLGEIILREENGNIKTNYSLVEMSNKWKDQKLQKEITRYTQEISKIQKKEQQSLTYSKQEVEVPLALTQSCRDCHKDQYDFWSKTAHSLAHATLIKKNAQHNPQCIECHSYAYQKKMGFSSTHDIVHFGTTGNKQNYWKSVLQYFAPLTSIRSMSHEERAKHRNSLNQINQKFEVTQDFTNVQCFHCHKKSREHPFEMDSYSQASSFSSDTCITCHTATQSPSWYKGSEVSFQVLQKKIREVSCPTQKKQDQEGKQ